MSLDKPAGVSVSPAHDVAQLLQVGGGEVAVAPVTALDVLIDAVQVQCV